MSTDPPTGSTLPQLQTLSTTTDATAITAEKGKSVVDDEDKPTCGICLSDIGNGTISRGSIDSCDHHFCFVCIMEWSKVESKCPLCKRRFSSIRRPRKPGVFESERVVSVPVRDQVYHHFGNASVGPPNLYSDIKCSVCLSGADESLLLLCDLCDSASHTYCAGLGATVPEGDWFCTDCTVLRAEHAMDEIHDKADNQSELLKFEKISSSEEHVSIFDIVSDPSTSMAMRSYTSNLTSSIPAEDESGISDNMDELDSRRHYSTLHQSSKLNSRTLWRCRNVHARIQALRENWNDFQNGSLRFSSARVEDSSAADQRPETGGSSSTPGSASSSSKPLIDQNVPPDMSLERGSYDITKAWKMMDIAKSVERGRKRSKILPETSNRALKKINAPKESDGMSSRPSSSTIHQHGYKVLGQIAPQMHKQYRPFLKDNCSFKGHMLGKQHQTRVAVKDIRNNEQVYSPTTLGFTPSQKVNVSFQHESINRVGNKLLKRNLDRVPLTVQNKDGVSACLDSSTASAPVASNVSCSKPQAHKFSTPNSINPLEGRVVTRKNCVDDKPCKEGNDAKSEIQSLVKLNLKILSRDKKLDVDAFKQIARRATHSILGACGLENPKPGVRPFSGSICCHANEVLESRRSSLMPDSCRECFYVFVKDVVNTTMKTFTETD